MDKEVIELHARLTAIEHLLAHSLKIHLNRTPSPVIAAKELRRAWVDGYRNETFANLDPALSDLYADAVAQEIDRILSAVEEMTKRGQS